jgi:hypothetical protein
MGVVLLFAKYMFYVIIILVLYTISTNSSVLFTYFISTFCDYYKFISTFYFTYISLCYIIT